MRAIATTVQGSMEETEARVREALSVEGFGVLTEIDVAATLAAKLGVQRRPMKILGACNPQLAHRALEIAPSASLVLPCNVVLEATDEGTRVAAVDPTDLLPDPQLAPVAQEAAERLRRALEHVGTAVAS